MTLRLSFDAWRLQCSLEWCSYLVFRRPFADAANARYHAAARIGALGFGARVQWAKGQP